MTQIKTIAVLGGGGRTGKYIVEQLLESGHNVRALIRNKSHYPAENPLLTIISGDALDPLAIHNLLTDADAVLSTLGQRPGEPLVASQATFNILNDMLTRKISRYILVAGVNIEIPTDKKRAAARMSTEWMKQHYPLIHEDRQKAWLILADSNIDWTLVRVPLIEFTGAANHVHADVHDCGGSKITAGDIASFVISQVEDDAFIRQAPFIWND